MIIEKSIANGSIIAPPSKSFSHRALICAALSNKNCTIKNICFSEDINATLSCIKALNINFSIKDDCVEFFNNDDYLLTKPEHQIILDCNNSASTLRFFIPICMFLGINAKFIGSKKLFSRPMKIYKKLAHKQKIKYIKNKTSLIIQGNLKPQNFIINGKISSQFISGLLFVLPLLKNDSSIKIYNQLESSSYVKMTINVLKDFGINIDFKTNNFIYIKANQHYKQNDYIVEGDYSNSVFFDVYNYLNGNVKIIGLNKKSIQGDKKYIEYLKKLCKKNSIIDIQDCPDLGPLLICFSSIKHGATFINTKRLKYKESNRANVLKKELKKLNIHIKVFSNKIVVPKCMPITPNQTLYCYNDHRITMSLVTLLSIVGGKIIGTEAVKKSFPNFFYELNKIGINCIIETQEETKLLEQ